MRSLEAIKARVAVCALPLAWFCLSAGATEFRTEPSRAEWKLATSPVECRLSQSIPYFGEAVFRQRAGESGLFLLSSNLRLLAGEARVLVETPAWREPMQPLVLGSVQVQGGRTPVQIGGALAEKLLSALFDGLSPVIRGIPSNSLEGSSSVWMAGVNFRPAYTDYRNCLEQLLPASYADVARTRVSYAGGGTDLNDGQRAQLDLIVRYMKIDPSIKTVYVDGYSDVSGRPSVNLELSRQRSEAVTNYLIAKGVPAEIITTHHHGARYPVARGNSRAALAQNRRVTVRLEKE